MDMKTVLVFCIISDMYCEGMFVKKYTTVDISCPFTPTSWYHDQSIISNGRDVHPDFTYKYHLSDNLDLTIYNFTDTDQGQYKCTGIFDEAFKQNAVPVNLCYIPEEISDFSFKQNTNGSELKRNLLCKGDTINQYNNEKNHKANIYIFKNPRSQEHMVAPNEETFEGHIMEYECLILNTEKCITNNNIFQLKVQWVSNEEMPFKKKNTKEFTTLVSNYTCNCSPTYAVNKSNCTDTIQMYERNQTLYLNNSKLSNSDTFLCYIDQSDILKEIISTTECEHADINFMQLTYTFGGIAAVLVVILLFAGAVIIAMAKNKRQLVIASVPSPAERIMSVEDEIQQKEPAVPDYLDIIDIVNPHSIEMTNDNRDTTHIPNSTYSRRVSSDYESIDSRSGNTDTSHEQDVVIVDSTNSSPNNSFDRSIHLDSHQYANTNIMNTYEQLQNRTRDIHTYKDLTDGF